MPVVRRKDEHTMLAHHLYTQRDRDLATAFKIIEDSYPTQAEMDAKWEVFMDRIREKAAKR